jgi:hypothetical protein
MIYLAALVIVLLQTNCRKDTTTITKEPIVKQTEPLSLANAAVASIGVQTVYGSPYAAGALNKV